MALVPTHDLKPNSPYQQQTYNGQYDINIFMGLVPLTRGYYSIISPEDFCKITAGKWFACINKYQVRAARMARRKMIYLSHEILGFSTEFFEGKEVDHINRNSLDNRRSNLRIVTHTENMANSKLALNRVGICYNKRAKLWMAYLDGQGKRKYLGYRKTREEAQTLLESVKCQ